MTPDEQKARDRCNCDYCQLAQKAEDLRSRNAARDLALVGEALRVAEREAWAQIGYSVALGREIARAIRAIDPQSILDAVAKERG